jgi:hypothetical protein
MAMLKPCVLTKNMPKPHVYYQPLLICHYSWYTITWAINPYHHWLLCPSKYSTRLMVSSFIYAWFLSRLSSLGYIVYTTIWPIAYLFKQLQIQLIESVSIYLIVDLLIWSIYSCSGHSTTWSCILSRWRIWDGSDGRNLKISGEQNRNRYCTLIPVNILIKFTLNKYINNLRTPRFIVVCPCKGFDFCNIGWFSHCDELKWFAIWYWGCMTSRNVPLNSFACMTSDRQRMCMTVISSGRGP